MIKLIQSPCIIKARGNMPKTIEEYFGRVNSGTEEISIARAASLLGLHALELRERFLEKGIPLRLGPADKADAQAEIDALRAWKRKAEKA